MQAPYLMQNKIICPHCGETWWKYGEDKVEEINLLLQINCPFIPVECSICEEMFVVRSHIAFEVCADGEAFEDSKDRYLTNTEVSATLLE